MSVVARRHVRRRGRGLLRVVGRVDVIHDVLYLLSVRLASA
jgi:hypothetical protein